MQAALLKPDFLLVGEVGGDGGVGDAQVLDIDFTDHIADLAEDLFTANRSKPEADIHQAQHIEVVQALNPVPVHVQFAGGVNPAHHRAHRATGDTGDFIAAAFQLFNHADMGIAPGTAGAQYQCNTFFHEPHLRLTVTHNAFL